MTPKTSPYYLQSFHASLAALVVADWSAEQISTIPKIAEQGMREGIDSPLLWALAGENERANSFELEADFRKSLKQLGIKLPDFRAAIDILLSYYCNLALEHPTEVVDITNELVSEVMLSSSEEKLTSSFGKIKQYAHDNLGKAVAELYGLYYDYDELNDYAEVISGKEYNKREQRITEAMLSACRRFLDDGE